MTDRPTDDDDTPRPRGVHRRRRRLLQLSGLGLTGLLAGCGGGDGGDDATTTAGDDTTTATTDGSTTTTMTDDTTTEGTQTTTAPPGPERWNAEADEIVDSIEEPTFPDEEFDVTEHGAAGDGETDDSAAFEEAVAACADAGGGRVVVPEGEYLHAGPIHLRSDVNLHVTPDATVRFGTDPADYLPVVRTWWEGNELQGRSPLIYARDEQNIAITGGGTLDAAASQDNWWAWQEQEGGDTDSLIQLNQIEASLDSRVFGEGTNLRPPFVQPLNCERVLIEDVTLLDSPFWFIHLPRSEHVTLRNVTTDGQGPNNDGCDPEFAQNVLVEGCTFDNGDDNVALKAGRNYDGRRVGEPTENVVIQDCEMRQGHGAVVAGSEMSAGVQNVYARRNVMRSPELGFPVRIKSNAHRGGFVRNWFVWDTEVETVYDGGAHVRINLQYQTRSVLPPPDEGEYPPEVGNVNVESVTSEGEAPLFDLRGLADAPVDGVTVAESSFSRAALGSWNEYVRNVELRGVDTAVSRGPTETDLVTLREPTPALFGMRFEDVTDADGEPIDDETPYLTVATAEPGTQYYVDREYEIGALPDDLEGGTLIRGKNDDKGLLAEDLSEYLVFEASEAVRVAVAFHPSGDDEDDGWWPEWLDGWEQTGTAGVSDPHLDDDFVLFEQEFEAGDVALGPNDSDTGSAASYFTVVAPAE